VSTHVLESVVVNGREVLDDCDLSFNICLFRPAGLETWAAMFKEITSNWCPVEHTIKDSMCKSVN